LGLVSGKMWKKMISLWCNKWLSRMGRLVLAKFILESLPVYWMNLAFNLKGVLERIRKISFNLLWVGDK